jgi:CHAT domain-containing protein
MAETADALDYLERARACFEKAGLNSFLGDVLLSLGETYLVSGNDTAALGRFERALELGTELRNPLWQAYALRFIGVVYLFRNVPATAVEYFERSLDAQQRITDPRFQAQTRADLGEAFRLLGQFDRAQASLDAALALSRAAEDHVGEARALSGLARVSMSLDDLDTARRHVVRALTVAESVRAEVESRDLRASYFASVHRYHELHMEVLMRLHKVHPGKGLAAAAFEASERARARSLLDGLTEAGVDLRKGVDRDLLTREQALQLAFDNWAERQRQLTSVAAGTGARGGADEYRDLETRYNQVQAEIRRRSPRYAALAKPRPLTLTQVQQQVLDPDTLLLEYALGEERSYLWAVSKTDAAAYELPPRAEISRAAQRLYERLTARLAMAGAPQDRRRRIQEADVRYWDEAGQLSEILLGPVAKTMAGKRIVVVADGVLQYLPFAALPLPGSHGEPVPLLVSHEVVSLPSASVLAVLRRETTARPRPAKAVAVLADPVFEADDPRLRARLRGAGPPAGQPSWVRSFSGANRGTGSPRPGVGLARDGPLRVSRLAATRLEADAIMAVAPAGSASRRIDFEASRDAAMSPDLAQYRIVHFATHGVFDNDNPGLSGIMLSLYDERGRQQDGFLRLHDIFGLRLPAELIVLSGCNTALGKQVSGEGLVGIVRGFMYAGAKRVVASLWKVDDEATGEMMRRFYVGMIEQHLSPAAALREAQLAMWRQPRWHAPFYWAAFALQGEWNP